MMAVKLSFLATFAAVLKTSLRGLPLAWAQLSHQKVRLAVALLGVGFANILMFTQLGLLSVLYDGTTLVHENLSGDLYLLSTYSRFLGRGGFPKIHLYQADSVDGVAAASPLYIGSQDWTDPEALLPPEKALPGGEERRREKAENLFAANVRVIAFNPTQPVLELPEVTQNLSLLSRPDGVLFDRLSQPDLGPVEAIFQRDGQVKTILGDRRAYVVGLFELGSTLFQEGNVIMSDWNYAQRVGAKSLNRVALGVLTLEPGAAPDQVQKQLKQSLPSSLKVLTKDELIVIENEARSADPSGKVLGFGAVMGFIVGVIVVYQVLYTDVADHLPEYATLKAMGYSTQRLIEVVLFEAMLLAILGFVPGCLSSIGVYKLLTWLTKIPVTLRFDVASQVFGLTVGMCVLSGVVALRKLSGADPADIF